MDRVQRYHLIGWADLLEVYSYYRTHMQTLWAYGKGVGGVCLCCVL